MAKTSYIPALRFRWLTGAYDIVIGATTRERTFKQRLIDQARIAAGHDVLDLGCGTGTLAIWAAARSPGAHITGVDGDDAVLARARRKAHRQGVDVRFDRALSQHLPYPPARFDRVVSSLFFHHLTRAAKLATLAEARRVLRPGGELHIADWGRPDNGMMRAAFLPVQWLDGFESTADHVEGRLPEFMTQSGFSAVRERGSLQTVFGTLAFYSAVNA